MSWQTSMGRLSAIITILPASMLGGWLLGYYVVDRYLGSAPWGGILLTLGGAGIAFYEIWQILVTERGKTAGKGRDVGA